MDKILMTGFDAFGGEKVNPASRAVEKLAGKVVGNAEIVTVEIPTIFGKSARKVQEAIAQHKPRAVISVGQAGGTHAIRVERLAVNIDDARIPDNEGNQPKDRPIAPDGPVAYWTTLPVREIVEAICRAGIPAFLSYTAGTFVCNHVFYATSHYVAKEKLPIKVGFIHVPYLPEQVVDKPFQPSMSEDTIAQALEIAARVVAEHL